VIQLRSIERWNGVLPFYLGGQPMPFIDISPKAAAPGK